MVQRFQLRDSGPPLSCADIAAFEDEIAGHLPHDYKAFLLRNNGGITDPELGLDWRGSLNTVPYFYELLPTPEEGLRSALRRLREADVCGYLPITSTLNGEVICLPFASSLKSVWLADYSFSNENPAIPRMFRLADSFTELCEKKLVLKPDVFCPIQELGEHGVPADLDRYLSDGNSLNGTGKNGLTILCEAIKFENLPMVDACLRRGASLFQALHIAVRNRQPEIVKRLVEAGADINGLDDWGFRPLKHVAGICLPGEGGAENRAMQELLLKLGANPSDAQIP